MFWGVQEVQDGAKFGQVGPKLRQVRLKLASEGDLEPSSRHLEAILPSCSHLGLSWSRLGGNLEAIWSNLSRQRGFLGSKVVRSGGKVVRSGGKGWR